MKEYFVIFDANDKVIAYVDRKGLNDWLENVEGEWYYTMA
jgi:hypothetical protein